MKYQFKILFILLQVMYEKLALPKVNEYWTQAKHQWHQLQHKIALEYMVWWNTSPRFRAIVTRVRAMVAAPGRFVKRTAATGRRELRNHGADWLLFWLVGLALVVVYFLATLWAFPNMLYWPIALVMQLLPPGVFLGYRIMRKAKVNYSDSEDAQPGWLSRNMGLLFTLALIWVGAAIAVYMELSPGWVAWAVALSVSLPASMKGHRRWTGYAGLVWFGLYFGIVWLALEWAGKYLNSTFRISYVPVWLLAGVLMVLGLIVFFVVNALAISISQARNSREKREKNDTKAIKSKAKFFFAADGLGLGLGIATPVAGYVYLITPMARAMDINALTALTSFSGIVALAGFTALILTTMVVLLTKMVASFYKALFHPENTALTAGLLGADLKPKALPDMAYMEFAWPVINRWGAIWQLLFQIHPSEPRTKYLYLLIPGVGRRNALKTQMGIKYEAGQTYQDIAKSEQLVIDSEADLEAPGGFLGLGWHSLFVWADQLETPNEDLFPTTLSWMLDCGICTIQVIGFGADATHSIPVFARGTHIESPTGTRKGQKGFNGLWGMIQYAANKLKAHKGRIEGVEQTSPARQLHENANTQRRVRGAGTRTNTSVSREREVAERWIRGES